jgi:hypothetical protein
MWTLAPREGQELLGYAAFALVLAGFGGVLLNRTYGVLALLAGGVASASLFALGGDVLGVSTYFERQFLLGGHAAASFGEPSMAAFGIVGSALVFLAALPFLKPMASYVLSRR